MRVHLPQVGAGVPEMRCRGPPYGLGGDGGVRMGWRDPEPWSMTMLLCSMMYCIMTIAGYDELQRYLFMAGMTVCGVVSMYLTHRMMRAEREFRERYLKEWMEKANRNEKEDE